MREVPSSALPWWLRSTSVGWGGALLLLLVVGLTAGFLYREARELEASEVESAELYARVLQDHDERIFNTVDIAMAVLAGNIGPDARSNDKGHIDADLAKAVNGLSFVRSFSLMTAKGRVIASSSPANVGIDVDTASVKLPAIGAVDALGSSVPGRDLVDAQRGRVLPVKAARSFVPLVRPVGNIDGDGNGEGERKADAPGLYIVAALNPDFFGNEYELTLADASRGAGLFSIDAVMLAGTGNLRTVPGERAAGHAFFTGFLPSRESGSHIGSGIDGGKVITAFRVLRKRPLVVIVERSYTHLSAGFNKTLWGASSVCAGAMLMIVTLMLLGRRSLRSHEAVRSALEATRANIAASEHDLRVLVESVHELIFRVDARGRIVFVNGRWPELTQRPASDVLGKRLTQLCRPDERRACHALFSRTDVQSEALLVNVANASGAWLTLDLSVSRVLDAEGRTTGFAGFALDVSAREAAKRALESQMKFSAQLLEASPTPIFVKDENGKYLSVNRAWLTLMGLTLDDVLGHDSAELFGTEGASHTAQDELLSGSEGQISYASQLIVGGRSRRDTVVTKVRFTRGDGTPAGIVGSVIDVTEFREAERSIRKARDAAELANRAKSEFISNISHELRTPLQGIIGFSEIGRDMSNDLPDFLDMFSDIHAGGHRMLALVNGLLDVSQMDSAVGSLPLQRTDLAQLLRDTVMQLQSKAVVRDLKFDLRQLTDGVECDADSARLQQALRNVLANALRYSPVGQTIVVALRDRGQAGIELTVRDHGPGIPEKELELVFEAFVQSTRTRDGSGGTGLGLTIARKIIGAHGGTVVAANAEGGGTLVTVSLPAAGALADSLGGSSRHDADGLLIASEVS